jgi:hypothetical protein
VVQDQQDESVATRPRPATGRIALFAGVAGACVFGAALGMWARPSDLERPGALKPVPQAVTPVSTDRRIPIVVDDSPAPIGKPLDVLSQSPPRPAVIPRRQDPPIRPVAPDPQLLAPSRPPSGLVRVTAPAPAPMAVIPQRAAPAAAVAAVAAAAKLEQARREQARLDRAKQQQARLDAAKVHAAQLAQARAERAQQAAEGRAEARAEAKAEKLAQLKAHRDKAKAHQIELARAAADARAQARARHGVLALIARLAPHHVKLEIDADNRADRRHKAAGRDHQTRLAKAAPRSRPAHGDAPAAPLVARGAGPIRVANVTTRCASPDPGEALACGDPALGAAQRRLTRAYAEAEAAGVPSATLEQQQTRWRAARAAAAREAPWAVREVYQARIAELQDLTRSAKGE